jgi:hypothetical protein
MPLAMRSYYDSEKFEDNYWSSNDEEGANQYFYHDKKYPNGYRYSGTRTVKGNIEFPDGFIKGIMPQQYDWRNDYRTKIYVPFQKFFKTRCNVDSNTWEPYSPNGHNVHKHPRHALPPPEEEEGTNLTVPQKRAEIMNEPRAHQSN